MHNIIIRNDNIAYEGGSTFPTLQFATECKGGLHSLAGSLENNTLGIFFPY